MSYTCRHGERKIKSGESANGPWCAAFCPTPKGTPDQCPPIWLNPDGTPRDDDAAGTRPSPAKAAQPGTQGGIGELIASVRELIETLRVIHGVPPTTPSDAPMPVATAIAPRRDDEIDIEEIPF
jgi:hypothetical protein